MRNGNDWRIATGAVACFHKPLMRLHLRLESISLFESLILNL